MTEIEQLQQARDTLTAQLSAMTLKQLKQYASNNSLILNATKKERIIQSIVFQTVGFKINSLSIRGVLSK